MITNETRKKLDDALRRYHELGWKKRRRLLTLIAEYVPQDKIEHVLDKSFLGQGWVSWEVMNDEQRDQARKIVAIYIEVWTAFWFNNWEFKINSKGDVGEVRKR